MKHIIYTNIGYQHIRNISKFLESVLEAVSLQTGDDIDFSQVRGNKDELN